MSTGTGHAPVLEMQGQGWTFSDLDVNSDGQVSQSPCSYFEDSDDSSHAISSSLDFEESRAAFIVLLSQTGVNEPKPVLDGLVRTRRTVIARWPGKIGPFRQTELVMEELWAFSGRSSDDHFEIIWNGSGFELLQYLDEDKWVRRWPRPAAALKETVKLRARVLESALILSPREMRGLIPLFIVIDFDGTVTTKMER